MDLESITERFRCSQPLLHVEGVVMLRKMLVSAPTPPDAAYAFALRSLSSPHSSIAQPIVTLVRHPSPKAAVDASQVEELVALGKLPLLKAFADLSDAVPSATGCASRLLLVTLTAPAVLICTPSCWVSCASAKPLASSTSVRFLLICSTSLEQNLIHWWRCSKPERRRPPIC